VLKRVLIFVNVGIGNISPIPSHVAVQIITKVIAGCSNCLKSTRRPDQFAEFKELLHLIEARCFS